MNNILEYLEKMANIQHNILEYIDDEDILAMNKIVCKKDEHIPFLYLLSKISNNHHQTANIFSKIKPIFEFLKDDLCKFYSNSELFHIFRSCKGILLFLTETKY